MQQVKSLPSDTYFVLSIKKQNRKKPGAFRLHFGIMIIILDNYIVADESTRIQFLLHHDIASTKAVVGQRNLR